MRIVTPETIKEYALEYNPFEGDFGEQGDTVFKDKIVKTRKDCTCLHCKSAILKGEEARKLTAKFDGELKDYTWCVQCFTLQGMIEYYLEEYSTEDSDDSLYDLAEGLQRQLDHRAKS